MRNPIPTLTAMVALVLTIAAAPAYAFDLTGHWTGKYTCKGFAVPFTNDQNKLVNKYTTGNTESTLDITQIGGTFAAVIDAGQGVNGTFPYNGVALTNAKDSNKGEAIFLACVNGNTLPATKGVEIIRAAVSTKDGTFKATIKALSLFADDYPEIETCKYSYKRIDTNDPGVSACPP